MTPPDLDPWTIVLAAGDGTRLRPLTRALHGEDLPKQFAVLRGERSLLEETVARAGSWSRRERIVVVVARDREELAARQLRRFPGVVLVAQPRNVGTGPGLLLPLSTVLARDPGAHVVVLPSDQFVRDEAPFLETIRAAAARARDAARVVLVGAVPEKTEEQYGFIVPGERRSARAFAVESFREKPGPAAAATLGRAGALWSTFVMAGAAARFHELAARALPCQTALLDRYRRALGTKHTLTALFDAYARMPPADFSRHVLEVSSGLEVVALPPCGWSDWGTPERVLESLEGTPDRDALLARLAQAASGAAAARRVA